MSTTYSPCAPARPARWLRQPGRVLLAVVGLATVLLASACDTAQQVPWVTYSSQLQQQIDAAAAVGNCATLQALLTAANATSRAHEMATGYPNDALVSYIQAAQQQADCPAKAG
jgi:hypothetical protein